jgi:hypothetical protein
MAQLVDGSALEEGQLAGQAALVDHADVVARPLDGGRERQRQ